MVGGKTKREIGSEFWFEKLDTSKTNSFETILPEQIQYFMSGRSAISFVIKILQLSQKRILLPSYTCESVVNCFLNESCQLAFYDVNKELLPDVSDNVLLNCDAALVCDFWGFQSGTEALITRLKCLKKIVIQDVTHSIFSDNGINTSSDAWVGSLRKWFAVPSGGVSCIAKEYIKKYDRELVNSYQDVDYVKIRQAAYELKKNYMETGVPKLKNEYRELFYRAEDILDSTTAIYDSDETSKSIICHYPLKELKEQRRKNFRWLLENFSWSKDIYPVFTELPTGITPLFFPVYTRKRNIVQQFYLEKKIYMPIHWPKYSGITEQTYPKVQWVYEHILSIPCDQRYTEEDMQMICEWSKKIG
ncbi:MAG: hypothetical protein ACLTXS_08185 [[Clostridium] symbiosum]